MGGSVQALNARNWISIRKADPAEKTKTDEFVIVFSSGAGVAGDKRIVRGLGALPILPQWYFERCERFIRDPDHQTPGAAAGKYRLRIYSNDTLGETVWMNSGQRDNVFAYLQFYFLRDAHLRADVKELFEGQNKWICEHGRCRYE